VTSSAIPTAVDTDLLVTVRSGSDAPVAQVEFYDQSHVYFTVDVTPSAALRLIVQLSTFTEQYFREGGPL
jgi:hypothetical protein